MTGTKSEVKPLVVQYGVVPGWRMVPLVGLALMLAIMGIAVPMSRAAAAEPEPYHSLDAVYCANDTTFMNVIAVPNPTIFAMNYRDGVVDYQWATWRAQLYQQVGNSWALVGLPTAWQPLRLVHDGELSQRDILRSSATTFPVARGANYRVAFQVYWYRDGDGGTVPLALYSTWKWAAKHLNDTGYVWGQYFPDLCHYPVVTGLINM